MEPVLELLARDCSLDTAQMAVMLGMDEDEVAAHIRNYRHDGVLLGRQAIIDWDKTDVQRVSAFIELKVNPQPDMGFDKIAGYIAQLPEVQSLYLMSSAGSDLMLTVEGSSMKEVAFFVVRRLAPLEGVVSTATHFVLKKYKYKGIIYSPPAEDERENCN